MSQSRTTHHHHPVVKPEGIYPRAVVYPVLGEEEKDGEPHYDKTERIIIPSSARYHNNTSVIKPLSSKIIKSRIKDSEDYRGLDIVKKNKHDDCQVKYDWQRTNRQNCNSMHEATDLTERPTIITVVPTTESEVSTTTRASAAIAATVVMVDRYKFLTHGYFRDVFMLLDEQDSHDKKKKIVFKPMRYEHDFDYRNLDRMRRDALTMDQLTGAKHVINIYANCGTSGLFEYADGGDIKDAIWLERDNKLTQMEKLHIATQAAMGLASFHNMDEEGRASAAHTDISPTQFIKVNGVYKLNDFNRARFLKYFTSKDAVCPFYNDNNWGKIRAPEEYMNGPETEMGKWPFDDIIDEAVVQEEVANGVRPIVSADIWNSTDPVDHVLKQAMIMCLAQEPHERKTARQIETYLKDSMRELDPGRLEEWGDAYRLAVSRLCAS